MVEANPLFSGIYHIEIVAHNGLVDLAYKTEVLAIDDKAQWNGSATVGAYHMAFQQECKSVYAPDVQAKLWRGKWVKSTATSPKKQLLQWLQACGDGAGVYQKDAIDADTLLPLEGEKVRQIVTVQIPDGTLDWAALCDAHLDTLFGSQTLLTDATTANVILCFDAETLELIGVVFSAQQGQTTINGTIILSATDGQTLDTFPEPETLEEGTLHEEWSILEP